MKYDKNKSITPKSNDTPTLYSQLSSRLEMRTDWNKPFLLMPVRLETRFQKVDVSLVADSSTAPVKAAIGKMTVANKSMNTRAAYPIFRTPQLPEASIEVKTLIDAVAAAVDQIKSINLLELAQLNQLMDQLNAQFNSVSNTLQRQAVNLSVESDVRSVLAQALGQLQLVRGKLSGIPVDTSYLTTSRPELTAAAAALKPYFLRLAGFFNQMVQADGSLFLFHGTSQAIPAGASGVDQFHLYLDALRNLGVQLQSFFVYVSQPNDLQYIVVDTTKVNEQLSRIFQALNATPDMLTGAENQEQLFAAANELRIMWLRALNSGAGGYYFAPDQNFAQVRLSTIAVPPDIQGAADWLASQVAAAATLLLDITADPKTLDAVKMQQYLDVLAGIKKKLRSVKADSQNARAVLVMNIDSLNTQFASISRFMADYIAYLATVATPSAGAKKQQASAFSLSLGSAIAGVVMGVSFVQQTAVSSTSWFALSATEDQLWVRAYPDDILHHSHETKLTRKEYDAGIGFWNAWLAAHGYLEEQQSAWRALVAQYGPQRAAWIVRVMTPVNKLEVDTSDTLYGVTKQLGVLNDYTYQVTKLLTSGSGAKQNAQPSQSGFSASMLSVYQPQLAHLNLVASGVTVAPQELIAQTTALVDSTVAGIKVLSGQLLASGSDPGGGILDQAQALLDQLRNTTVQIPSVPDFGKIVTRQPAYPAPDLKDGTWTEASKSQIMPDRFVFAAINDDGNGDYVFRHLKVGERIPATLYTGINPKAAQNAYRSDSMGNVVVDPDIQWMFDFAEAERVGMGVRISLNTKDGVSEAATGFDKVLALGLRLKEGTGDSISTKAEIEKYLQTEGKTALENLLLSHHYSGDGMSVLTNGTPTNNTEEQNAGYRIPDEGAVRSFETELGSPLFTRNATPWGRSDGQVIADALGVEYSLLEHIENAGKSQVANAIAMNRSLWPATAGSFMRDMMYPLFTADNIERTRQLFGDYVIAGGAVPSIRVRNQPYGILPTTAFSMWTTPTTQYDLVQPTTDKPTMDTYRQTINDDAKMEKFLSERFDMRLHSVLQRLTQLWLTAVKSKRVLTVNKDAPGQDDFLTILGTEAQSAELYSRLVNNDMTYFDPEGNTEHGIGAILKSMHEGPGSLSTVLSQWHDDNSSLSVNVLDAFMSLFNDFNFGEFTMDDKNGDRQPDIGIYDSPIFKSNVVKPRDLALFMRIMNTQQPTSIQDGATSLRALYPLHGPTVDEQVLSEDSALSAYQGKNYIQWMLTAAPSEIWNNNDFRTMRSRSLLFLLLRQGLLSAYRDAAWDVLETEKVFPSPLRYLVGTPEGLGWQLSQAWRILTKWQPLFRSINSLLGGTSQFKKGVTSLILMYNNTTYADPADNSQLKTSLPAWWNLPLETYLQSPTSYTGSGYPDYTKNKAALDRLGTVKTAMQQLTGCSPAELDRLMRSHIDTCSYRVDAWNYAMVHRRLWTQRNVTPGQTRKTGIYLGAYGWLLDVRPAGNTRTAIKDTDLPAGLSEGKTVYYDAANLGFIHAPSMAHALTAAVLRAGYKSENTNADRANEINLTSERVRSAMHLLEGVRNGQTLSALLGYQLERGLHENYPGIELDEYIYNLRSAFPLSPAVSVSTASDKVRTSNVVDGVELLRAFRTQCATVLAAFPAMSYADLYEASPAPSASGATLKSLLEAAGTPFAFLAPLSDDKKKAIVREIDRVANALDAVGDIAVVEGVFQTCNGNPSRASAMLESLSEGKAPPQVQFVDTPRSGTQLAHRVAAMVPVSAAASPWTGIPMTPRANAEPSLNRWIADLLVSFFGVSPAGTSINVSSGSTYNPPNANTTTSSTTPLADFSAALPGKIRGAAYYGDTDDAFHRYEFSLADLKLQPIDLLYMVQTGSFASELTRLVVFTVRQKANYGNGLPRAVPVRVSFTQVFNEGDMAFHSLLTALTAIASIVRQGRPLRASDFVHNINAPQVAGAYSYDVSGELKPRYNVLSADLDNLISKLDMDMAVVSHAATAANNANIAALRDHLRKSVFMGVGFGVPESSIEGYNEYTTNPQPDTDAAVDDMRALAVKVRAELADRRRGAQDLVNGLYAYSNVTDQSTVEDNYVEAYTEAIKIILGGDFSVFPVFKFDRYKNLRDNVQLQIKGSTGTANPNQSYESIMRFPNDADIAMDDWLTGVARVQEKMAHVETVRMLAIPSDVNPTNSTHPFLKMRPVQFPYITSKYASLSANPSYSAPYVYGTRKPTDPSDYWLGIEYKDTYVPSGEKMSITLLNPEVLASDTVSAYAGILIDEWSELLPEKDTRSGLTFNYNQPDSKAPQNLLLAVNARSTDATTTGKWTVTDLMYTLLDTIDMAKVRMVEPDHFKADPSDPSAKAFNMISWMLPAVMGETTPHSATKDSTGQYAHTEYFGASDSIQQVSFDYNPVNDPVLPNPDTSGNQRFSIGRMNWQEVDTDAVTGDPQTQAYIDRQKALIAIAQSQNQLKNYLA